MIAKKSTSVARHPPLDFEPVKNRQHIHMVSIRTSARLSRYYYPHAIAPLKVIAILARAGIRSVLIGVHALGGWMDKPRTTDDVDILVASRIFSKTVRALLNAFAMLIVEVEDFKARLLHRKTNALVIDILKPKDPVLRATLTHTHTVCGHRQTLLIPSLEMSIAMRFAQVISPFREQADQFQDAHDFMRMVKVNTEIDLTQLAKLGELVYPGGGAEIVEKVRQVRAGEKMTL